MSESDQVAGFLKTHKKTHNPKNKQNPQNKPQNNNNKPPPPPPPPPPKKNKKTKHELFHNKSDYWYLDIWMNKKILTTL